MRSSGRWCESPLCNRRDCWSSCFKTAPKTASRIVVRFWDTSAMIPLVANEPSRERMLELLESDSEIVAWWGTPIEITSSLARREREKALPSEQVDAAVSRARQLSEA